MGKRVQCTYLILGHPILQPNISQKLEYGYSPWKGKDILKWERNTLGLSRVWVSIRKNIVLVFSCSYYQVATEAIFFSQIGCMNLEQSEAANHVAVMLAQFPSFDSFQFRDTEMGTYKWGKIYIHECRHNRKCWSKVKVVCLFFHYRNSTFVP